MFFPIFSTMDNFVLNIGNNLHGFRFPISYILIYYVSTIFKLLVAKFPKSVKNLVHFVAFFHKFDKISYVFERILLTLVANGIFGYQEW